MRDILFVTLIFFVCVTLSETSLAEEKPFYLTVDSPPAPELTPQEALRSFTLAPGFEVELVVAEPLVEDPVAIAWDERGHLYVAEMRGFMPDAYGNGEDEPVGVIVRLSDQSGDGTLDTREVLLDNLVLPRAIAIVNEGLLVGEPPNLWLCPSLTGFARDINCDKKRNLGSYGDQPGSVEHAENGLLLGLDNWLYSAKSNRRLRLRGTDLVEEPTLFRGQWGITQDNDGRLFYNTNSSLLLGDFYDAQQIVAAGNRAAPGLGARISSNDQMYAVRVNAGVNRAYVPGVLRADGRLNRPTAASGMVTYRGDQFGAEFGRDVFVAEPAANAIAQLRLQQQGLEIKAEHVLYPHEQWQQVEFFASTDERFRPVDVKVGPDGALYIVDMYRGIVQDYVFLSDELRAQALARGLDKSVGKGRIWRVRTNTTDKLRKAPKLDEASLEMMIEFLGHANAWHRETAQRLLIGRNDPALNEKLQSAVEQGARHQAVHALWTLSGRGALQRQTIVNALGRDESSLTLNALRAGGSLLSKNELLSVAQETTDPVLRQQILLNLTAHNSDEDVLAYFVSVLLAETDDAYALSALKAAVHTQEQETLQSLLAQPAWGAELEQQTGFVKALVVQGFQSDLQFGRQMLDFVQDLNADQRWLQVAVLDGLFDVSRGENFQRVMLAEPHAVFATTDDNMWPATARARRAFTWPDDDLAADVKPLTPENKANHAKGKAFYLARCANCHGDDGVGIASLAPALVDSPWVTQASERLARIVLHGLQGPIEVAGETWNGVMPGHGAMAEFNDDVASGLMTYLLRAWGHTGRAIDPLFVADIRQQTAGRTDLWTVPELMALDINTHYRRYTGRYGRAEFPLEFIYNGQELEIRTGIYNGPLVAEKEDYFLFEPRRIRFEFVNSDADEVVGLRMSTSDGEVFLPRLEP